MEEIPIKYIIFVTVTLTTFTECTITTLNVVEGDAVQLDFTYFCNSTIVTLQWDNNGAPFYNSANPNLPSLSSNLKLRNETDGKICFLHLTIDSVSRDDQGGYILTAYKNGPALPEYHKISLRVEYPPGKASCELSEDYIDRDWVRLRCAAPRGSLIGHIVCYQNGIKIPPLTTPEENDQTLSQTQLAKLGDFVYCCSSTWDQTKDRCECKDFVWDPIQNKQVMNVTDPCPTTLPIYPALSEHPIEDIEFESTSPGAKTQGTFTHILSNEAVYGLIVVLCVVILAFVISIIGTVYYFKRRDKKLENFRIEIGEQISFIAGEEMSEAEEEMSEAEEEMSEVYSLNPI